MAGLLERLPPGEIIAMTRQPAKLADTAADGVEVRQEDFDDPASLERAFAGAQTMLLISASLVGKGHEENASLAVSDHRGAETLLRDFGLRWSVLRNTQYTEAVIEAQAPHALSTGRWIASAADGRMAQVTRQACVACAVAVLTTQGHEDVIYDITGPELMSFRDIAAVISEIAGRPIEYVVADDEGMYAFFDSLGVRATPPRRRWSTASPGPATTWSRSSAPSGWARWRSGPTTCLSWPERRRSRCGATRGIAATSSGAPDGPARPRS